MGFGFGVVLHSLGNGHKGGALDSNSNCHESMVLAANKHTNSKVTFNYRLIPVEPVGG